MSKILVIADTHISPSNVEVNKELWSRLGEYCVRTRPDYIVHLGDVGDFNSQAWLKAVRGMHTLEEELESVSECLTAFEQELTDFNRHQRIMKKKLYRPSKILTLGNHDIRNGITNVQEMFEDYNWYVEDHLRPVIVEDITFCHSMCKGLSDNPCTTAQELIENWHSNIVVGHGHHKDFFESYSMSLGSKITALKSPVFGLDNSEWAIQIQNKWSTGFTEITTDPFSFVWRNLECL